VASYVCVQLVDNVCQSWAEAFQLPPLSIQEGGEIGVAVLLVYVGAWGFNLLCRQILNSW